MDHESVWPPVLIISILFLRSLVFFPSVWQGGQFKILQNPRASATNAKERKPVREANFHLIFLVLSTPYS